MNSFELANKPVGEGNPCFIVFEAGPTHDGLPVAIQLADAAKQVGADAIKFQIFDADRLVADKKQLFTYEILVDRATGTTETVSEPLYDILARRCLPRSDWIALKKYCDALGLAFFSTVGFEEDVAFLVELGCHSFKVASSDINHIPLIKCVAKTGLPLQLDTGNATLPEIRAAVAAARSVGNERIIVHQCPTGYPAYLESINLRAIPALKSELSCPVAFSDHTPGWDMDVAAVALGANMVEKTITLDRTTRSVEHMFSLEPGDMRKFISTIRNVEMALGSGQKRLSDTLPESRKYRRSMHLKQDVKRGQPLTPDLFEFRRPGWGIGPDVFEAFLGKRFSCDMPAGAMVELQNLVDD